MKRPGIIEQIASTTVYYATPYHSLRTRPAENTNGLLSYFFNKKMSFANIAQEDFDIVVNLINKDVRKRLNEPTPAEVFGPSKSVKMFTFKSLMKNCTFSLESKNNS